MKRREMEVDMYTGKHMVTGTGAHGHVVMKSGSAVNQQFLPSPLLESPCSWEETLWCCFCIILLFITATNMEPPVESPYLMQIWSFWKWEIAVHPKSPGPLLHTLRGIYFLALASSLLSLSYARQALGLGGRCHIHQCTSCCGFVVNKTCYKNT